MPGMESSARATNYYNLGTAAPTIQSMIDAEAKRAHALAQRTQEQRVKTLAQAQKANAQKSRTRRSEAFTSKARTQSKARKKDAQRDKALANAHKEADCTIARVQQLKEPNIRHTVNSEQTAIPRQTAKVKTESAGKSAPAVSIFAILGTLFVSVLMVFVVLAQINFNETAAESARLNILMDELAERQRLLELSFESAVDIREVERFARDELGMSRPDARQTMVIEAAPRDIALALDSREDRGLEGFSAFLRSLTDYFRR
jgi:cell division protein FtsL